MISNRKRPAGAHVLHPQRPVTLGGHTHPNVHDPKNPTHPMRPKRPGPSARRPHVTPTRKAPLAERGSMYSILKSLL